MFYSNCSFTMTFNLIISSACVCVCVQDWAYDEEGQLVLAGLLCLDVSEVRTFDPPRLMKCHGSGGSQQWSLGVRHQHTHTHTHI